MRACMHACVVYALRAWSVWCVVHHRNNLNCIFYIFPGTIGKGKRGVHKGKGRHFTNEEELKVQNEKKAKEKEWRVSTDNNIYHD